MESEESISVHNNVEARVSSTHQNQSASPPLPQIAVVVLAWRFDCCVVAEDQAEQAPGGRFEYRLASEATLFIIWELQ